MFGVLMIVLGVAAGLVALAVVVLSSLGDTPKPPYDQ